MKKILTASLVAIMAVTAANADIASTTFVTDITGNKTFTGSVQGSADLTAAVNTLAGKIDTVAGDGQGSVAQQITSALSTATADKFSTTVQESLTKANNSVQTTDFDDFKGKNTQAIADAKQGAIDAAAADATSKANAAQAAAEATAKGYTDTEVVKVNNALTEYKTSNNQEIANLKSADTAINGKIGEVAEGKTVVQMIADAKTAATYNDGEVRDLISGNATAIQTINDSAVMKSGIDADKVAQIATNASDIATIKVGQSTQDNKISALETSLTAQGATGQAIAAAQAAADNAQGDIDAYKTSNNAALEAVRTTANAAAVKTDVDASILDLQGQINAVEAGTSLADNAVNTKNIAGKAVTTDKIADAAVTETQLNSTVNASLDKADSAVQQADVTTGTVNGTIKVKGTDVSVAGLGSAAYTESNAYATAAQGAKADTAMQASELKELASWSSEGCATGTCSLVSKEGSIAWEKVSY